MGLRALRLHQQALHSGAFVAALAQMRKRQFTQEQVAARAGLSVPTVRLVERGGGDQASLVNSCACGGGGGVSGTGYANLYCIQQ
jgi:hypothetical protein